jgi:P4 family phage/plasmid primase-like protien
MPTLPLVKPVEASLSSISLNGDGPVAPHEFQFSEASITWEQSDESVARLAAQGLQGGVCYDTDRGIVFAWNGVYWAEVSEPEFLARVREMLTVYRRQMLDLAEAEFGPDEQDKKKHDGYRHSKRYRNSAAIKGIAQMVKSEPSLWVKADQWDSDPYLLGAPNGVINLRTGALLPPNPSLFITKTVACAFDPEATSEEWERVLDGIFDGDEEVKGFVQELLGYASCGEVTEAVIPFFFGAGRNGKDTIAEAAQTVLGNYAKKAPEGLLTETHYPRHRQELAEMEGRRLYIHSEIPTKSRLNAPRAKELTGSATLTADLKGGRERTFRNETIHLLTVNELPGINIEDIALKARLLVVPFNKRFRHPDDPVIPGVAVADLGLKARLPREHPEAILAWVVKGAVRVLKRGHLHKPESVRAATESYRQGRLFYSDEWGLIPWVNNTLEVDRAGDGGGIDIKVLYEDYAAYAKRGGFRAYESAAVFSKALVAHGISGREATQEAQEGRRTTVTRVTGYIWKPVSDNSYLALRGVLESNRHQGA